MFSSAVFTRGYLGHSLKRRRTAHVVNKQGPKRVFVVHSRDGAKPILPRNVPQLQSHGRVVDSELLQVEVDAYRRLVVPRKEIVHVSLDNGCLARGGVPQHQHLAKTKKDADK